MKTNYFLFILLLVFTGCEEEKKLPVRDEGVVKMNVIQTAADLRPVGQALLMSEDSIDRIIGNFNDSEPSSIDFKPTYNFDIYYKDSASLVVVSNGILMSVGGQTYLMKRSINDLITVKPNDWLEKVGSIENFRDSVLGGNKKAND